MDQLNQSMEAQREEMGVNKLKLNPDKLEGLETRWGCTLPEVSSQPGLAAQGFTSMGCPGDKGSERCILAA